MIKYFTEIHFAGLILRDPVTVITNILLFASAFWCFRRIFKNYSFRVPGANDWSLFFLFLSISGAIGGFTHGFSYYTPPDFFFIIWIASGWIQMLGVLFALTAGARMYDPEKLKIWVTVGIVQMIICGIIMVLIRKFLTVDLDTASVLIPVAIISLIRVKRGSDKSRLFSFGILSSAIPALITIFKISPSPWFNFNDISHLLVCVSTILMCIGLERNFRFAS